jgi:hypothetical protein
MDSSSHATAGQTAIVAIQLPSHKKERKGVTRSVPSNDNVGGVMTRLTRNGRVTVRICKTNSDQLPDETFDQKKKKEKRYSKLPHD